MNLKEIITEVQSMSDIRAGKVLKLVFSAVSDGEGFSTGQFEKAIRATDRTVRIRLHLKPETELEKEFENFRVSYKGTKRSFSTEFGNFKRKHSDWMDVTPKLMPAWVNEVEWHERLKKVGAFCPEYKNLQTWINQRCWEQEFNMEQMNNGKGTNNRVVTNADNASNAIRKLTTEFS